LNSIDDSIDIIHGNSKLFNLNELKQCQIDKPSDLLLLFLPNFNFSTPFHFMFASKNFDILKKIIEKIDHKDIFTEFLKNDELINKILKMFIYILKEEHGYQLLNIKTIYCTFSYDDYEENESAKESTNDSEDAWEKEEEKNNRKMLLKIKKYFNKICKKIMSNKTFTEQYNFVTY